MSDREATVRVSTAPEDRDDAGEPVRGATIHPTPAPTDESSARGWSGKAAGPTHEEAEPCDD